MLHHGLYEQVINNALNSELPESPQGGCTLQWGHLRSVYKFLHQTGQPHDVAEEDEERKQGFQQRICPLACRRTAFAGSY